MNIRGISTSLYGFYFGYERIHGSQPTLEQVMEDCARTGVDAIEVDPTETTIALTKQFGLQISATYIGLPLHQSWESLKAEEQLPDILRRMADTGVGDLLINADPKGGWGSNERKTEEEVRRQGENLVRLEELIHPYGIKLCFHNHGATKQLAEADLRSIIEYGGSQIGFCIDTGWAHVAGYDPLQWVDDYPGRVNAVHLRNQLGAIPAEDLIDGEINLTAFINKLKDIQYSGWLALELYHPAETGAERTLVEDMKRSVNFVKSILI
jgi:inosose dehydratase